MSLSFAIRCNRALTFTVTVDGRVMTSTTTNNVSRHIFQPHFPFISRTGRNIESRPGEALESGEIFQLIHDV